MEATDKQNQLQFMEIIKEFPILLSKSQLPVVKVKKEESITQVILKLQTSLGVIYTKDSLCKKISRMKTNVKTKCDANKTGDKKINMSPWEKIMFDLIQAETNPSIARIPGAVSTGQRSENVIDVLSTGQSSNCFTAPLKIPSEEQSKPENMGNAIALFDQTISPCSTSHLRPMSTNVPPPPLCNKKRRDATEIMNQIETEDTKLLSTSQLQRLVLLEQLQVLKLKKQRLQSSSRSTIESQQVITYVVSSQEKNVGSTEIVSYHDKI